MSEHYSFKFNCGDTTIPSFLNYFIYPNNCTQKQLHEEYVSGTIDSYILKKFKRLEDGSVEIPAQEDCVYGGTDHPALCLIQINLTKVWDIVIDNERYATELDYLKHCLIVGGDSPITEPMKQLFLSLKPRVDIERKVFEESVFSWVDAAIAVDHWFDNKNQTINKELS